MPQCLCIQTCSVHIQCLSGDNCYTLVNDTSEVRNISSFLLLQPPTKLSVRFLLLHYVLYYTILYYNIVIDGCCDGKTPIAPGIFTSFKPDSARMRPS